MTDFELIGDRTRLTPTIPTVKGEPTVYHVISRTALDGFGLREFAIKSVEERFGYYRQFVYEKGALTQRGEERVRGIDLSAVERFRYRTRYFTDSGIIGTKEFVDRFYKEFKNHFSSKHEKRPKVVKGLEGVFSLKRLSEAI